MTTDDRSLHPAPAVPAARAPWPVLAGALLLLGLWALLQLWGLGKVPFHTHGEAREGLVVWQMTHGGGWILPLRDGPTGVEVPSKPPLFHWLGALTARVTGTTDEWSIRFPSTVLSLAGGLTIYAAGVALWGVPAGLIGAVVTLTSFEWQRAATSARVDTTLTVGLLVAFLAYLFIVRDGARARWLVAFYGGMAVAVLAKGPVGVALPALFVATLCAVQRDVTPLRQLRLVRGLLAVALIAGLWYVLALFVGGFAFFGKQVLNENVFRMFDAGEYEGGHRHGPLYLLGGLAAGFLPWTLFVPAPLLALWHRRRELSAGDPRVHLLLWIVVVFGLYALAVSKRSVYLLGLYPALGLLIGWWAGTMVSAHDAEAAGTPEWWRATLRATALAAMGMVLALLAVSAIEGSGAPLIEWAGGRITADAARYGRWVGDALRAQLLPSLALLGVASGSLGWLAHTLRADAAPDTKHRWVQVFAALVLTLSAADVLIQQIVLPEIAARKTYRAFMPAVRAVVGDQATLFFYRTFEYGAVFYWGGHIGSYDGELSVAAPRYLLMAREDWARATPAQRELFERVALPTGLEEGDERRLVLVHLRAF